MKRHLIISIFALLALCGTACTKGDSQGIVITPPSTKPSSGNNSGNNPSGNSGTGSFGTLRR